MSIAENLRSVRSRIETAARKGGREPADVTIVAVTKTVAPEQIREAVASGITCLGENRVQEARDKIAAIGRVAQWDFIGHLQTNKAALAATLFDRVHSVDSERVAWALDRAARKQGRRLPVLVQVNLSGEESKFGVEAGAALDLLRSIAGLANLAVEGLMTIPPYVDNPDKTRALYRGLRELRDEADALALAGVAMTHLSMGMSHDYPVAVEEGATLVRIGTAIFGQRP